MSICQIDEDGTKRWRNSKNQFHREDGPAVEWADGTREWWLNGQFHREDGPAVEWSNGTKYWYLNGHLHREVGPAIEWADGDRYWYLNDREYSFKDYCSELLNRKLITENKLGLFQIKYGE